MHVLVDDLVHELVTSSTRWLNMIPKMLMTVEVINDYGMRGWINKACIKVSLLSCSVGDVYVVYLNPQ